MAKTSSWLGQVQGTGIKAKNIFLNDLEKSAILKYISSEAYILNEKLRNGSLLSDDDKKLIAGIDAALEKLPKYQGTVYPRDTWFKIIKNEGNTIYMEG